MSDTIDVRVEAVGDGLLERAARAVLKVEYFDTELAEHRGELDDFFARTYRDQWEIALDQADAVLALAGEEIRRALGASSKSQL